MKKEPPLPSGTPADHGARTGAWIVFWTRFSAMTWNATREPARVRRAFGPVVDDLEGRTLLAAFVSGVEHRTTQLDVTVANPASTPVPTSGYTATIDWGDGQ